MSRHLSSILRFIVLAAVSASLLACGSTEDPQLAVLGPEPLAEPMLPSDVVEPGTEEEVTSDNWSELERRTYLNAAIIQIAVEDWSQENGGGYPYNTNQASAAGHSLIDYLPDGQLLANPFHLAKTEPVDGAAAAQGQVGYLPIHADGWSVGYVVTAYGEHGEILNLTKLPRSVEAPTDPIGLTLQTMDPELLSLRNAVAVRSAVRRWSEGNGGGYPSDLSHENARGNTLVDLLPGGILLINPYTAARSEPRNGGAVVPGSVAYVSVQGVGQNPSYHLEAFGEGRIIWSWVPGAD